jgi:hypothetical protein
MPKSFLWRDFLYAVIPGEAQRFLLARSEEPAF